MPEFCVVLAERQNTFFFEIAQAICDELHLLGQRAWTSVGAWPKPREDLVFILVPPHEYYRLEGIHVEPTWQILKRTIFICAEQPGTSFFDDDVFLADRAGAVFDVSRLGVKEFHRRGMPDVQHFPLGWTPAWSPVDLTEPEPPDKRDLDVLHLGIFSPKRARDIATAAPFLWHRWTRLQLSDDHGPNTRSLANYATGDDKWQLLARTRVLLNVHVADRPYFEWQRIVQAISSGCAIVSEHSVDFDPLVPGEHILFGRPETLGLLAQDLIEDEDQRAELARSAWLFLREERPFARSVELLVEAAEAVNKNPLPAHGRATRFRRPSLTPQGEPEFGNGRYPSPVGSYDDSVIRAGVKDVRLDLLGVRREIARMRLRERLGEEPPIVERVAETTSYAAARPRVSFVTALYNHAHHISAALDSAARSEFSEIELVVTDDGSGDASSQTVREWMARAQNVPALLVRHPVNRGLGAARNTAIDFARGEFVFVLDADNEVYPTAVDKLVAALDWDSDAVFAYSMLEMFDVHGAVGLRSYYPWRPERLREANFVDAMALIRRGWLIQNGEYTTDARLHGWEDYDLWCRVAERGRYGIQVPEVLGRYRSAVHSMLSLTDISSRQAVALMIDRHPDLFAGVEAPL